MNAEQSTTRRRIFIVDDHPLVREWLTNLINQQPDLVVCGEAESVNEANENLLALKPDAAIVDISLKGLSGIEFIREAKRYQPDLAVIVLSMHEETHYAQRALSAGARGYLIKRETANKVIEAIRQVLQGKLFLSETVSGAMLEQLAAGEKPNSSSAAKTLSDRELQVFELIGGGQGTRQVAETLGISLKTVQAYCARIKLKLQLHSASELLREAIRFHDTCDK